MIDMANLGGRYCNVFGRLPQTYPAFSGVASTNFLGGKSFDFKRAAVFCKQINSFFLAFILLFSRRFAHLFRAMFLTT